MLAMLAVRTIHAADFTQQPQASWSLKIMSFFFTSDTQVTQVFMVWCIQNANARNKKWDNFSVGVTLYLRIFWKRVGIVYFGWCQKMINLCSEIWNKCVAKRSPQYSEISEKLCLRLPSSGQFTHFDIMSFK